VSRPASGLDVILILESVTPPFMTRPFVIGLPAQKERECYLHVQDYNLQYT